MSKERRRWEGETLAPHLSRGKERKDQFRTATGREIKTLYDSDDADDSATGFPGEAPFTRGIQPNQYRGRLWTMRQYAGFGSAAETNQRFRYLLERGQTGLSVAFDLPTQMGYDSDHSLAESEVGRVGVAIDTRADMETLMSEIDMAAVSTSMTINAPAAQLLLFYVLAAEKQGVEAESLRGTIQNDVLKEYIARGTYIYPPAESLRLVTDTFAWCAEHAPRWNTISISGYHIREAGSTAVQELAFTFANAIEYVRAAREADLPLENFLSRLSFFFNVHSNIFEEVAKFRAARQLWVRILREKFGVGDEKLMRLRFHAQTAGSTLTAQQPLNNVVRVTLQALAAVMGGTQSLHTNSFDEALALPTTESVKVALRTQQVIAEESGAADTVDPLGGSYLIERWTTDLADEAWALIERVEDMGGAAAAIQTGFQQDEIGRAAWATQQAVEDGSQGVVGVNVHEEDEQDFGGQLFKLDPELEAAQRRQLEVFKASRDEDSTRAALDKLADAAGGRGNLLPPLKEALAANATLGETCERLRGVFGRYHPGAGS